MEPECLEPLNLVIKKDAEPILDEDKVKVEDKPSKDMAIQDKTEDAIPAADQKFLTALYMSSLMHMSSMSTPRSIAPQPVGSQHNFMHLLAMVEARHRMWQQMSWPPPPNLMASSLGLSQPYFDNPVGNLTEQLSNSTQNSTPTYPSPSVKHDTAPDTKQTFTKRSTIEQKNSTSLPSDNTKNQDAGQQNNQDKKKPHIKKPLNAFMLYMKEMRAKVVAECTLKESAAINQILGRRWHALGREEQAKYYELARRERQLHMQLYPDWSSRANTNRTKKRKRKQDTNSDPGGNNMKKCRARYGLDQQSQWCKPCRRKKKCIRYMGEGGDGDGEGDGEPEDDHSEDNLGSVGEAGTPEEDESLSSPGGLSGLSSLASPSLVLPSPSSLASPCPLTPPVPPTSLPSQQVTAAPPPAPPTQQQTAPPLQPAPPPHRNPVGTNPHDINNPLSVNQLTGQCIKSEVTSGPTSNPAISVT